MVAWEPVPAIRQAKEVLQPDLVAAAVVMADLSRALKNEAFLETNHPTVICYICGMICAILSLAKSLAAVFKL